jgi:hypothetical protein
VSYNEQKTTIEQQEPFPLLSLGKFVRLSSNVPTSQHCWVVRNTSARITAVCT